MPLILLAVTYENLVPSSAVREPDSMADQVFLGRVSLLAMTVSVPEPREEVPLIRAPGGEPRPATTVVVRAPRVTAAMNHMSAPPGPAKEPAGAPGGWLRAVVQGMSLVKPALQSHHPMTA